MRRRLALRINYVGELGWELHLPMEQLAPVYDLLWEARAAAMASAISACMRWISLRMEKCYRGWKTDMTHEYTPLMASLDRFVDLAKPAFRGRDALIREHNSGPKERLRAARARRGRRRRRAHLRAGVAGRADRRPRHLGRLRPRAQEEHRASVCAHRPGGSRARRSTSRSSASAGLRRWAPSRSMIRATRGSECETPVQPVGR